MTGLGDSIAASAVQTFNPQQYVPPEIQDDINTGAAYYAAFKTGASHVSVQNGTVQISDQASEAILQTMVTTIAQMVPVLGQAFAVFMALEPKAGPGPGTCATQPPTVLDPANPKPSELSNWQYYTPWSKFFESYTLGDPNSFEAYANTVLQWNWELAANCFGKLWVPSPGLLAALVSSWNATHQGPQRTVTRTGLNNTGWGLSPGYDPIANALETAIIGNATGSSQPTSTSWSSFDAQQALTPHNVTSSFTINDGPEIGQVRTISLHLNPADAASSASSSTITPMSTGSKVAISAAVVVGSAAAGVGIWAFMTHQGYGEAWSRVWKKSGGKLLR